jgi:hypothetical protein
MHGNTLTLSRQKTSAAANAKTESRPGSFRRWLKANKLPLAAALAAALALGSITYSLEANTDSESESVSLYKQGKISKSRLSLGEKMNAWGFDLLQGGECGANYRKVLSEIRDEQLRLMATQGNEAAVEKLLNLERLLENAHRFNLDRGICTNAGLR